MGNKLELTWYGKEEPIKVEPRLLIHDEKMTLVILVQEIC